MCNLSQIMHFKAWIDFKSVLVWCVHVPVRGSDIWEFRVLCDGLWMLDGWQMYLP